MRAGCRLCFILALCVAGCRRNDLVENELRARDIQYREALEELNRTEARNNALRLEVDALRSGQSLSPEAAANTFGVKRIVLGRATAGVDNDGVPGDESLQVWLEPKDSDEHTIKAPGALQVCALEFTSQGQKAPLSSWNVDADKLRSCWKQGLLSSGYQVVLPWQLPPRSENLRIVVRLTLSDGRTFETDKDIKVRLLAGAGLRPETIPPAEVPLFKPASFAPDASARDRSIRPASHWQPQSLQEIVELGRPLPALPPPVPDLLPPLQDMFKGIQLEP